MDENRLYVLQPHDHAFGFPRFVVVADSKEMAVALLRKALIAYDADLSMDAETESCGQTIRVYTLEAHPFGQAVFCGTND